MYYANKKSLAPSGKSGNLYYIRLRTNLGLLYKVGFTSRDSVKERLAFKNAGDARLVEKTIMFIHLDNAYEIEQEIHGYFYAKRVFGKFGNYSHMPLAGNGQSELYAYDILGLDREYADGQAEKVIREIKTQHAKQQYHHPMMVSWSAHGIYILLKIVAVPLLPLRWLNNFLDRKSLAAIRKSEEQSEAKRKALVKFVKEQHQLQST